MKNVLTIFTLLIAQVIIAQTSNLTISPTKVQSGQTIKFEYNISDGPLSNAHEGIDVIAVEYIKDQPQTVDLLLNYSNNKLIGQFNLSPEAQVGMIVFQSGERWDNNQGNGYFISIHDAKGNVLPQSLAAQAVVYRNWGSLYGLDRKATVAYDLFSQAFAQNESLLQEYYSPYVSCLMSVKRGDEGNAEALAALSKVLEMKDLSADDKISIAGMLDRLKDSERANQLRESVIKDFPKGDYVRQKQRREMRAIRDLAELEKAIQQYQTDYASVENLEEEIGELYFIMGSKAAEAKDWEALKKVASKMPASNRASLYNNTAWSLAEDGEELDMARMMASEATEWARQEMLQPQAEKPGYFSYKKWDENRKFTFAQNADTYAFVLFQQNDPGSAARYQAQAVEYTNSENLEMNERYTEYLEKLNAPDLRHKLEGFILHSQATSKMKDQFKKLYASEDKSTAGAEAYLAGLEQIAKENRKKEIATKMLNQPAPGFELKNLDGETVSLSSLKGKIVVVDFWATWCGPCKASFPGMQEAQNNFQKDPNVAFVFIDSWERVDDRAKVAGDFINSKGYTFNVLLDLDDQVISSFGVTGIPTKFILDRNGNIRFKSIGFSGGADALVEELTAMIELVDEQP